MTRDCCWTSSCRVVVLSRLPRSSLQHSQQLLQLCYHSPAARASSLLPLPRFFLSSRSFLSHSPSPSSPSKHYNLNRGTHRPQPPSHKPQPNMPAPQPVQVMDGGMVSRDSGLGAPTVESKSDPAHLSLPTRSTTTEPHPFIITRYVAGRKLTACSVVIPLLGDDNPTQFLTSLVPYLSSTVTPRRERS